MTLSSKARVMEPPSPSETTSVDCEVRPPPNGTPSTMFGSRSDWKPPFVPTVKLVTASAQGSAEADPAPARPERQSSRAASASGRRPPAPADTASLRTGGQAAQLERVLVGTLAGVRSVEADGDRLAVGGEGN